MMPKFHSFLFVSVVVAVGTASRMFAVESALVFEKDVRPILKAQCFHCHGEDGEKKGELDVRLARLLQKGGKSGPSVVAGKPEQSHILEMLKSGKMPKEGTKLPDEDIAIIERWIREGARTARPEPEDPDKAPLFTSEESSWWSLQPIQRPEIPAQNDSRGRNPIDAFLAAKLKEKGLTFSDSADAATLNRRLAFDLTGLPADTVGEKKGENYTDSEWSALVDHYLALPAYGERWGRHWLDVAGYADSDGYNEQDTIRENAWKYRDYVIQSLNADKPYKLFVKEQLAGDEMAEKQGLNQDAPDAKARARYAELLTATGFLRMAADGTMTENTVLARNESIVDTMKIVGTAFYGMTLNCAECHDHRHDPITQKDYYELRAVFEPGFNPKQWRRPMERLVSLQTKEDKARAAEIEVEAKKIDDARLAKQEVFITEVLEKELARRPEIEREPLRKAYRTVVKDRTPEQVALLKKNPSIEKLNGSSLYLYDTTYKTKHADELKKMAEEAAKIRATKPQEEKVQAFTELPAKNGEFPKAFLLHRGNPENPTVEVKPSDLDVLAIWRKTEIPEKTSELKTSGRRLALAEMLTDGEHPLLARVIVNRVWMHHFGTGLVKTVADFGHLGDTPSHPELLDWLASEFMAKGWSLKQLHRMILTSYAWRQKSDRDELRERIDPDNRLLSRQSKHRLEAEALRDALLSVSGALNPKRGGQPVPVSLTEEGRVVLGVDTRDAAGRQTGKFVSLEGEEYRRSVYVQIRRKNPFEIFAAFDAPDMTVANCEIRPNTTVSPQSLLLMNNPEMREFARLFAERILKGHEAAPVEELVSAAWQIAYGRPPVADELKSGSAYLQQQIEQYTREPAKFENALGVADAKVAPPKVLGLAALGQALMSANEFLYID